MNFEFMITTLSVSVPPWLKFSLHQTIRFFLEVHCQTDQSFRAARIIMSPSPSPLARPSAILFFMDPDAPTPLP